MLQIENVWHIKLVVQVILFTTVLLAMKQNSQMLQFFWPDRQIYFISYFQINYFSDGKGLAFRKGLNHWDKAH